MKYLDQRRTAASPKRWIFSEDEDDRRAAGLPTATLAQIGLAIDQWRDLKLSTRGTLVGLWRPEELT